MVVEKQYFEAEDGAQLFGLLHKSNENKKKKILIATHGMGSGCNKKREDCIAKKLTENGIDVLTYDNRGFGLINTVRFPDGKRLQGTVFEDVEDGYFDILGAINHAIKLGYEKIYLQGHSLGSTKTVYAYNKLIENNKTDILNKIKAVVLLSLVDVTEVMNYLIKEADNDIVEIALEKERNDELTSVITTKSSFMPYTSCKTFLRYYRDNKNIDFAKYTTDGFEFTKLNNINVPIFMRWGNVNELISLSADELSILLNNKLRQDIKDIDYVDGATHNYSGKEDILAQQILEFLMKVK